MSNGINVVFALALAVIIFIVGIFIAPTVKTALDSTIAADGAGWNSEVQAAVGMFFIIFLVLVGLLAAWVIFGRGR